MQRVQYYIQLFRRTLHFFVTYQAVFPKLFQEAFIKAVNHLLQADTQIISPPDGFLEIPYRQGVPQNMNMAVFVLFSIGCRPV